MQSRRLSTLDIPKKEKRFNTQDVNLLMQKLATRTVEKMHGENFRTNKAAQR